MKRNKVTLTEDRMLFSWRSISSILLMCPPEKVIKYMLLIIILSAFLYVAVSWVTSCMLADLEASCADSGPDNSSVEKKVWNKREASQQEKKIKARRNEMEEHDQIADWKRMKNSPVCVPEMFVEQWQLHTLTFHFMLYWMGLSVFFSFSWFVKELPFLPPLGLHPPPHPTHCASPKFMAVLHKRLDQGVGFFGAD